MDTTKRVIIFAGAVYDSLIWTNRQHVATRLAERGWSVLYVEPRLFWPRMILGGYPGAGSAWRWLMRTNIPQRVGENIWVVSQLNAIPRGREVGFISWINHHINQWVVRFHARRLGFYKDNDPVILLYDTEAAQYLPSFPNSRIVYDCVDDHKVQAGVNRNAKRVQEEEQRIIERADVISVTTEPLYTRFSRVHAHTYHVPNAADIDAFEKKTEYVPEDINAIPHPRIGVVGTIDPYKIDLSLICELAEKRADWHIVLIGPSTNVGHSTSVQTKDGKDVHSFSNVHFLGAKPRDQVPSYVHAFDVAIIPYVENEYNNSSFPLKYWEYMASGVPVISSGLPALKQYAYLAPVVHTVDEYISCLEAMLPDQGTDGDETIEQGIRIASRDARVSEAKNHDYSTRVDSLERLLSG